MSGGRTVGGGINPMRLRGLVRKEFLQIVRDPSSIAIAFVLPLILLLLFGYGVSLDAQDLPLAIVVEQPSPAADSFVASFNQSHYFEPIHFGSIQEAEQAVERGQVHGIVWLRNNFGSGLLSGTTAPIGLVVNGVDANTGRLLSGYVESAWGLWLAGWAADQGRRITLPVNLEQRIWFNPEARSRNFLVPGIIAVIMTLIGALLTALVVAREWERGTMEALLVTPVSVPEILLGKVIPYFALGMGGNLLSVGMAVWLFAVPLNGSLWLLLGTSALFLVAALGMGLLISTAARNQFVAGQVALMATFLPAFMLSGFIFDIGSMPETIQIITYAIAARYYVAILQTVFLAGNVWPVILANGAALVAMGVFFLGMVRLRTKKSLD